MILIFSHEKVVELFGCFGRRIFDSETGFGFFGCYIRNTDICCKNDYAFSEAYVSPLLSVKFLRKEAEEVDYALFRALFLFRRKQQLRLVCS